MPIGVRPPDRLPYPRQSARILRAYEHHAPVRPACEAGQRQALQHPLRVCLHQQPIGIGAGISLVSVDHQHGVGCPAGRLPLRGHTEPRAAASSQPGRGHFPQDLVRSSFCHRRRPHLPRGLTGHHTAQQNGVTGVVGRRDLRRPSRLAPRELIGQRRSGAGRVTVERRRSRVAVPHTADNLHRRLSVGRRRARGDPQLVLRIGEMPSSLCGEARGRRADPDVTAAVRGGEVRVVTGRSERGGRGKTDIRGDGRSPGLRAVRRSRPGLGQRLHQPVSRPPTPVGQGSKRIETIRTSHGTHDLIVGAVGHGRNSDSASACPRACGKPEAVAAARA